MLASPVPNFTLTASPTALAIAQGGSGSTTITVNPLDGFASGVSLNIPGFPGVTSSFSVNPTASSSIATVNVANSVPAGSYWLRFSGSSAALTAPGSIFLQVTPTYPFDMDITPDPISLVAGGAGSGNVTITPHSSLSENVDLTVISELPDGISASFSPASTEAHSSLLISAGSAVAAGNYQFNVAGTGENETAAKTVTVSIGAPVANARIASLSPAYAAEQGGTFILMVNGSGFDSGSVVYWQGTALATQFASATKLTANVPSSDLATPGVVTIQVKSADVTGNSTNSLQFEVDSVSAASGSPVFPNPTQSVVAGGTAQYTATLPSTATNVSATCLNLPAGATCTYASSSGAVHYNHFGYAGWDLSGHSRFFGDPARDGIGIRASVLPADFADRIAPPPATAGSVDLRCNGCNRSRGKRHRMQQQ